MPSPRQEPVYATDTPIDTLCTAEMLVVATLRLWARAGRGTDGDGGRLPDWHGGLRAARLDEPGIKAFDAVFRIVAALPRRPLDVRCPRCRALGADEGLLLQAVSLLQRHRTDPAGVILGEWIPPTAVRYALAPATVFAQAYAAAGLMIPLRHPLAGRMAQLGRAICADRGLALVQ